VCCLSDGSIVIHLLNACKLCGCIPTLCQKRHLAFAHFVQLKVFFYTPELLLTRFFGIDIVKRQKIHLMTSEKAAPALV
jgi:hypothetical protein